MAIRNKMFEYGILKQEEFDIPIVVVGNLAMGGTGKTPHVEYIVESLIGRYNIGVLSRGYRRSTKGFVLATSQSRPEDIGDESYQIYRKYGPDITLAVCEKRVEGIKRMREINPDLNMIILDDAFQHRYVKPSVSILLTEYNRPVFKDKLLPYGRLRETARSLNRADIVVVTKCPPEILQVEYSIFERNLNLFPYQKLFFSRYNYGHFVPLFPEGANTTPTLESITEGGGSVLVVTGVANPRPFVRFLRRNKVRTRLKSYPDHHHFTSADMDDIARAFDGLGTAEKFLVTTEKDAVRLLNNPYFPHRLKKFTYYIPIKVDFISRGENEFTSTIEKTIRDARLFKS